MWPVVGQILTDGLCAVNVYFWSWPPQIAAVFEAVTPGLFGARNVFWVGMVSHISDNSVTSSRTLKYGIMNAMYIIGSLIGTGVAGLVNVRLGFYGAFAVSVLLNVTALSIAWLFLQDVQCKPCDDGRTAWFNPKRLARGYLDVFRSGGTAAYAFTLLTLLVCQGTLVSRLGGEYAIMYLFMRYKFNWYEVKYSYYAAYKMITILFGTLFAVVVMSHRLKIHDAIIGCVACVFDMVAAIGYIFVEQPWQLYIVPAIDIFHGTALTITTSLTSKLVKSDELGRINSIQGLFSTLLMFVIVPLYTATYNFTFEHLAGAVFTLNIILTIPVLATFSIVYLKYKNLWTRETVQCNSEAQGSA